MREQQPILGENGGDLVPARLGVQFRKNARQGRRTSRLKRVEPEDRLNHWLWYGAAGVSLWAPFTPNPWLTVGCAFVPPLLTTLLWVRGEPPVLLFGCLIQWLQASIAVFYTNINGWTLERAFGFSEIVDATWLSLVGIVVLALGIRLAWIGRSRNATVQASKETLQLRPPHIFSVYVVSIAVFYAVTWLAYRVSALTQPLLALTTLQWSLVFLLAYSVLSQRKHYGLLILAVCYEFFSGVLSYFASFKGIFFVMLVALPSAQHFFKGWRFAQFAAISAIVVAISTVWTVIKGDYREFLSQGTGQQLVLVPVTQRVAKLNELVSGVNRTKLEVGLEELVVRVSYVKFFALCIAYVPTEIPHEHGKLWLGAVRHVLMPRFLFPGKGAISDSARTSQYTGIHVAGEEEGTSIGIGYMGESYVDFGRWGMFAPILLLGAFYGFTYRFFVDGFPVKVIGFAMATAILIFGAYNLETSNIKLVGGNLMGLLVVGLFTKTCGLWLWRAITGTGRATSNSRKQSVIKQQLTAQEAVSPDSRS